MSRVILIVMDGCGVGAMPDAADYGQTDSDGDTLGHVIESANPMLPNLARLGLSNIIGKPGLSSTDIIGGFGKCAELSKGKDSVTGHWEMMGIITETPFPTYPNGFPADLISEFERRTGRGILGNKAASGTAIISEVGAEHVRTGKPIVYTSADSVFQVAAHESVVSLAELYDICEKARGMLVSPNNVQRVIARPFVGDSETGFKRTENRKDYPLPPPEPNVLSVLKNAGKSVHAVGVVADLFPHKYFSKAERTRNNAEHFDAILRALQEPNVELIFANFEDFDMLYGHRNDVVGFGAALEAFDSYLGAIYPLFRDDDLLIITADHGNDPTTPSTDHSREYVPLLAYGQGIVTGTDYGTRRTFADIGATIAKRLQVSWTGAGEAFA